MRCISESMRVPCYKGNEGEGALHSHSRMTKAPSLYWRRTDSKLTWGLSAGFVTKSLRSSERYKAPEASEQVVSSIHSYGSQWSTGLSFSSSCILSEWLRAGIWHLFPWDLNPGSSFPRFVTLGKFCTSSIHFFSMYSDDVYLCFLHGVLWGANKLIHVKCIKQCLSHI